MSKCVIKEENKRRETVFSQNFLFGSCWLIMIVKSALVHVGSSFAPPSV